MLSSHKTADLQKGSYYRCDFALKPGDLKTFIEQSVDESDAQTRSDVVDDIALPSNNLFPNCPWATNESTTKLRETTVENHADAFSGRARIVRL